MPERQEHLQEVRSYLQKHFSARDWAFSLPRGTGSETYFVQGNGHKYFVKVGAPLEQYVAMAEIGLTPPVLSAGWLDRGLPILVQPFLPGGMPSRLDFQDRLEKVAALIRTTHHDPRLQRVLQPACSNLHKDAGLQSLHHLLLRWERFKPQVPDVSTFVDRNLAELAYEIEQFTTASSQTLSNQGCDFLYP